MKGLVLVDATSEDATLFMNNKIQRLRELSENRTIPAIKAKPDTLNKNQQWSKIIEMSKYGFKATG